MKLEENQLFHLFNQGNNKQKIFFSRDNQLYFLRKIRKHLLPHCNILCYCLMPNYFHFMIYIHESHRMTLSNPMTLIGKHKQHPISKAIAIILRSYTRAIQKQENLTGSLFRQKTKSKLLTSHHKNYALTCFHYIHQNPMRANLVTKMEDWEFSSFRDYLGLRDRTLCDKKLAYELIGFSESDFYNESYQVISDDESGNIY